MESKDKIFSKICQARSKYSQYARSAAESVSLDFMVRLPRTIQGHDAIAVFVDRLPNHVRIIPVQTHMSAIQIANVFQDTIFKHHGIPKTLVSDRDSKFTSEFWKVLFKTLGTRLNMSSSYHPQTDGQTEFMNRHIIDTRREFPTFEITECFMQNFT